MGEPNAHRFLFYAPTLGESTRSLELDGEESRHVSRVLRMSPGETAYATNGRGLLARCRVDQVSRTAARLAVLDTRTSVPGRRVMLALALLRKEAFERAVEQCTELGIAGFTPFVSERSHVSRYSAEFTARLRRIAVSAMKQSFRTMLPEVQDAVEFEELVTRLRGTGPVFLGDDEGAAPAVFLGGETGAGLDKGPPEQPVWIVVGPEGGLSEKECAALDEAGVRRVRVSRNRLRSETAAAALATLAVGALASEAANGSRSSAVD